MNMAQVIFQNKQKYYLEKLVRIKGKILKNSKKVFQFYLQIYAGCE